jgi:hypothetical protein
VHVLLDILCDTHDSSIWDPQAICDTVINTLNANLRIRLPEFTTRYLGLIQRKLIVTGSFCRTVTYLTLQAKLWVSKSWVSKQAGRNLSELEFLPTACGPAAVDRFIRGLLYIHSTQQPQLTKEQQGSTGDIVAAQRDFISKHIGRIGRPPSGGALAFGYHGTLRQDTIATVMREGFHPGYRSAQVFGRGEYFSHAGNEKYSMGYAGSTNTLIVTALLTHKLVSTDPHIVVGNPGDHCLRTGPCQKFLSYCLPILLISWRTSPQSSSTTALNYNHHVVDEADAKKSLEDIMSKYDPESESKGQGDSATRLARPSLSFLDEMLEDAEHMSAIGRIESLSQAQQRSGSIIKRAGSQREEFFDGITHFEERKD